MTRTALEKGRRIGEMMPLLLGVVYRWPRKGHPGTTATASRGTPTRRDPRRCARGPDLHRLILLLVVSVIASLAVTASASAATSFTNPNKITIRDEDYAALPYPSEIAVSGLVGPITDMSVTLHRFGHTYPADVDILLISPGGKGVVLMSDACGGEDIEDFTWTFSDSAPGYMLSDCSGFVYKPTNRFTGDDDPWHPPAPPGPYSNSLSAFDNENPNGTWKLYVIDDAINDSGDIEGGWSLSIQTGPVDVTIPAAGTSGTASTSGPASPYPATRIFSTSPDQVVSDVNVTIDGIWHENPEDLDLLLVGPQGQKVVLMSGACGPASVSAYGWVWDDEAATPMPEFPGTDGCSERFHRPSGYEHDDGMPTPAPAGPYARSLSAFDGTDPNGEWSLYVNDDADGGGGFFTNRFVLGITTVPRPNRSPDAINDAYNAREDTTLTRPAPGVLANDADADGDSLSASFVEVVDGPAKGAVTLRANGSFDYKPKLNRSGADFFVYRASDGRGGTDTATVEITIAAVNDAPKVVPVSPAPGSSTRDRTPLIRARAMDAETNLTEARIKLFVDGRAISATRFAYNSATDVLSHTPNTRLARGNHVARVVAQDAQDRSTSKLWDFRVN
jgi:subtilisin-like proprotein convertase family protein